MIFRLYLKLLKTERSFTICKENIQMKGKFVFYAKLIRPQHQKLNAPESGKMERIIHESVSCRVYYKFMYENKLLLELVSDEASFEYEMDCI